MTETIPSPRDETQSISSAKTSPVPTERELQNHVGTTDQHSPCVSATPFSMKASKRLSEKIHEYSDQLTTESARVSRWHQSEQVSTADVDHAADYLFANRSRKPYRHMGTVGGILLGTGGSNVLAMITTHQYTLSGIIVTLVLTSVGTFLIAAHMLKD